MVYMILIYSHRKKTQQRGQTKKNCPVFRPSGLARLPDEGYGPAPDGYSERLISPCAGSPFYSDRWGTTWKFCGNCIVIDSPAVNSEHPKIACALNMFKPVLPISWWDSLVLKVIPLRIFFFRCRMHRSPWWHALRPHWPGEGSFGGAGFRWPHWTMQVPADEIVDSTEFQKRLQIKPSRPIRSCWTRPP